MKVSIVGYGFVGKAIKNALSNSVDLQKVDPKLNTSISDLRDFKPNIIFICVPTPMEQDGSQNISILMEIVNEIKSLKLNSLVVIKSTIIPSHISTIEKALPDFVYNPEFLREKYADEDFINSSLIIFGGSKNPTKKLANFYDNFLNCKNKEYTFTDAISASFVKYTINTFLATKVIFFNELFQLFSASGASEEWLEFTKIVSKDKRIGQSHMNVPGHDGRYGFGGACLPKDSNAILKYAESLDKNLSILKRVIKTNNKIRASYNVNTERENEQNIFFEDK
tara:strand:+ start:48 stop:890 length:843 start_codon:yes stop_codon:yes gene_type:complete